MAQAEWWMRGLRCTVRIPCGQSFVANLDEVSVFAYVHAGQGGLQSAVRGGGRSRVGTGGERGGM